MKIFRRNIATVLGMIFAITLIFSPVCTAYAAETNIKEEADRIYKEKLIECGLIEKEQPIMYRSVAVNNGINTASVYALNTADKEISNVVAYMQDGDELVDAYTAISRSVATGKTAELKNSKIMGFTITVNYDYYYPSLNDYQYPYYRHGTMEIQMSTGSMITSIGNFNCAYVSRGSECDSEGNYKKAFVETISRVSRGLVYSGSSFTCSTGSNGNPYILKNSSTVMYGTAFSGIAYRFTFGNNEYVGTSVILYDETAYFPDLEEFDWGF